MGWNASTLVNSFGQTVTLSEFTGCFAPMFANNTLVGFTNALNGRSIVFSRNGQCWLKFIKPGTKRNVLQATTTVTISAAHLLPAVGGAVGDPHIAGPRGEHFEFQAQRAGRYTMIASPKVTEWLLHFSGIYFLWKLISIFVFVFLFLASVS